MVLPEVETTPLLQIRFLPQASDELIHLVQSRLAENGIVVLSSHKLMGKSTILRITAKMETLEIQAEKIHLMKETVGSRRRVVEYFRREHRSRFCDLTKPPQRDAQGLFTAAEYALLIRHLLDRVHVLKTGQVSSPLSQLFDTNYRVKYLVDFDDSKEASRGSLAFLTASLRRKLHEHGIQSACLMHVLITYNLVDAVVPVPVPAVNREIFRKTWWPWSRLDLPIELIQDYYGWEIGFYFAWMEFLTRWLFFPGILGLLVYIIRCYRGDTIDTDEYTPFYGLVTFLWAVLFLRFWERHEHRLAYQWGTFSLSQYERQKFFAVRPEFRGYLRKSPVTGEVETYYEPLQRRIKYIGSALVTSVMLAVAFSVMILSLNLQGYIRPKSNPTRWTENSPHPFFIADLAFVSEPGQVFDALSLRGYIPVVGHVICIFSLNLLYRRIAERLTSWENHETESNHRNSLILKRFLFEAFDCYVALFYLAFYERDVERLRLELIAVFQIDTIRRVLLECVIPILIQRFNAAHHLKRKLNPMQSLLVIPTHDILMDELDKDTYDQFDDYMEIVIQLGYVTLFASAYPLASLISIAANWVEIRSDCFKLTQGCQRPAVFRSSGSGMWKTLASCIIWTSALTNCLIAGFTSDQLVHYLPSFYVHVQEGYTDMGHEKGWLLVFLIFGLERILVLTGLLVYAIVPTVPEDVVDELERRQYIRSQQEAWEHSPENKKND
jgi:anoctamin-10